MLGLIARQSSSVLMLYAPAEMVSEELSACSIAAPTLTSTPSDRRTPHSDLWVRKFSESGVRIWRHNSLISPPLTTAPVPGG